MFIGDWVAGPVLRRVNGIKMAKIHAIRAGEERYSVRIKATRRMTEAGGNCPRGAKGDSGLC
jgi:hypothetical protein